MLDTLLLDILNNWWWPLSPYNYLRLISIYGVAIINNVKDIMMGLNHVVLISNLKESNVNTMPPNPNTHTTWGSQKELTKALNIRHNKNIILCQTIRRHFDQLS